MRHAVDAFVAGRSDETLARLIDGARMSGDFETVGYALAATGRTHELLLLAEEIATTGDVSGAQRLFSLAPMTTRELEQHALRLVQTGRMQAATAAELAATEDAW